ncbi:MAG: DUF3575 domain-containing protein, partial [Bacteroidota bacterium]
MKNKILLFLIFLPFCSYCQDSLRYNQWSIGLNLVSLLNVSPELNSEIVLNRKFSIKVDAGYRPMLNTLEMTKKL